VIHGASLESSPRNDNASGVAGQAEYGASRKKLRAALDRWMMHTKDPRATSDDDPWDRYPYFGSAP
jgi:hypothetical protein